MTLCRRVSDRIIKTIVASDRVRHSFGRSRRSTHEVEAWVFTSTGTLQHRDLLAVSIVMLVSRVL